ncbi:non-ribosomal peptide synthetase, partial [Pseudomonas sp. PS01300]|uniref:non-ribosomal peptide synthetase n=1 Tax=Pseudomonas sp. PS01300 TaxID=2991436 RepID=UPI00249B941C
MNAEKSLQLACRFIELAPEKRSLFLQALSKEGLDFSQFPIPAGVQVPDRQALSYAQQRMWFLWQLDPHSGAYNLPGAVRLNGVLDVAALERAFSLLVARHEVLRTVFRSQPDGSVQQVPLEHAVRLEQLDLSAVPAAAREARVQHEAQQESLRAFDLAQGPLLRLRLLKLDEQAHVLLLTLHHIVADGWSMNILIDEFARSYDACAQGLAPQFEALPIQYADYGLWQRRWLEAGEQARQLAYWREKLGDEHPVLELPLDCPRPSSPSFDGERHCLTLDAGLAEQVRGFARQHNVSLFMVLLAVFNVLLYRYTGQTDVRFGSPVANRNRSELEGLVGFFVNTQVLRTPLAGHMSFLELLQATRDTVSGAQSHQDLPFERLVEGLQLERSLSHSPLFQVMFNHQPHVADVSALKLAGGLQLSMLDWRSRTTEFDLSLDTYEQGGQLQVAWTYASDLFKAATIERMARHWVALLQAVVATPTCRLDELALLSSEERECLLEQWGRAPLTCPDLRVHQRFEAQVAQRPQALALIFESTQLSYAELNQRANRLARHLVACGVGPEVPVGIAVERGIDMIVGLLAVLKAGGAYVPLDPQYPQDRLLCMIEDSATPLVLTQTPLLARLGLPCGVRSLCLDQDAAWRQLDASDLANTAHAHNLAYVMFTSGSTGRPKGVGISHLALAGHAQVAREFSRLGPDDRILQFATFNFDAFVEQFYPALICGAAVVLRGQELWDSERYYHEVIDKQVSVSDLSTAYWNLLAKDFAAAGPRDYGKLRRVHIGGEAMPPEGVAAWRQAGLSQVALLNTYGPTEATVCVTTLECDDYVSGVRSTPLSMPIGRVLGGRSLHVLDASGAPTPVGVVGELVIGGELLARGYFNRPGLTAERFIPDPFAAQPGGRLYRSGDLARFNAEGVLEYAGRIDHQVKIRGFRIELGEVEARLLEQPGIREAVVLAQPAADGLQLVAYVVPGDSRQALEAQAQAALREAIGAHLRAVLPAYMVPAYLLFLERLPLSPNGKLDRKALPPVDASQAQHTYVAPQSALEQQVAAIWQDVLKLERVGLDDAFFEIGGHSLLATQVVSRVRQVLGLEVALRTLFERSRLGDFVAALGGRQAAGEPPFTCVERGRPLPLSYAQERQWFLWQLDPQSSAYHLPAALRLRGALDVAALQRSFDSLLARHESLRTTFVEVQGEPRQLIAEQARVDIDLQVLYAGDDPAAQIQACIEAQNGRLFALDQGPLLRVRLLRLAAHDHVLVLVQHHIVSDGWSMQVMVDELIALYAGYSQGREVQLPALPIQYADFAQWQRQWMEAGERERQLDYWCRQLGGEQPVLELPSDRPRPATRSFKGAKLDIVLDAALARGLRALSQREGVTPFMLLLASFQTLLHRYSGQAQVRVGVPVASRNRLETERLIGFFVNTLVLEARIGADLSFAELLQQVRQTTLQAQAHQDLPFEQLVEALEPGRSLSHSPLFQVLFNHHSEDAGELRAIERLPGLEVERLDWDNHTAQFDLTLDTTETADGLSAILVYATDLFDAATIERLARHWQNLLQAIVADPQQRVGELPLLDAREQQANLQQWNPAPAQFASQRCLHELIEAQAARAPGSIALTLGDAQLSYRELNERANQMAHALIAQGIGPEVLVGLACERSLEMVVGLLAILKAGGAYVPLDPAYPEDRLAYMMEDSGLSVVLAQSHLQLPVPQGVRTLLLDDDFGAFATHNPALSLDPANLAYVIYTSGSTGKPKGALLAHHNVLRLFAATEHWFNFGPSDVWSLFHSYAFDFSVWEIFGALLYGGR